MMYRMNSYNAHFSFARAQQNASECLRLCLHVKHGHLASVTLIRDQGSKWIERKAYDNSS
eukprot:scaffold31222_cov78-Skeletonema_dohrnii-CCMP3373.AAC.1